MKKIDDINDYYEGNVKTIGGLYPLVRASIASEYLSDLISNGYIILGLDSFLIDSKGAIQPEQAYQTSDEIDGLENKDRHVAILKWCNSNDKIPDLLPEDIIE